MTQLGDKAARNWVLVLASIAAMMVALDTLVVATTLTAIRQNLGASIEELEWTVNAYNLSFAVLLMPAAALGDRFGRMRLLLIGIGLFVIASVSCALSGSVGWLIGARIVQGTGAAIVMPLCLALVGNAFPPELRGKAMGIFSGVTGLAVAAGPVVGGAVTQEIAWQWIFWLNVPISLLLIPFVLKYIKQNFGSNTSLDITGLVLVTGAIFGLVWGLVRGNAAGWSSFEVIISLTIGVVLVITFISWELHTHEPMVPLQFFRSRAFAAGSVATFFLNASLLSTLFFIAQFLQVGLRYGPLDAGFRLIPWTATLFVIAPVAGSLVNRTGERPLLIGGLLLQAVGMAWIGLTVGSAMDYPALILPMIVAGGGVSMAMPASQSAVVGAVAKSEIGKASGTFSMLRQLGGVFGIAIIVAVFTHFGSYSSAQTFKEGFIPAIGVSASLSFLGAIAGIGLPGRQKREISLVQTDSQQLSAKADSLHHTRRWMR